MKHVLGRYTAVIVTTVVFLLLVVGVLSINFNLSFETEANAEVVNIAGRQRMLSQRIAKSLGNVKARYQSQQPFNDQLTELEQAANLFNRTLNAFQQGGTTLSTKSGESTLSAVTGGAGKAAVDEALLLWQPLFRSIETLQVSLSESSTGVRQPTLIQLNQTQNYLDKNINTLLKLMNDLTNYTESVARDAADQSRFIQTAGIIASLMCFGVIMFLIFGQLRRADDVAAVAKEETQQIFATVDQGLFLIDQDMSMGGQHSKALESIFSSTSFEGRDFKNFISGLVSEGDLQKIVRYLKLLFDPHKKQKLLKDLNPLNQLAIQVEENGQLKNKFLNFSFSRVMADGQISGVLSSVSDISREVQLAKDLEAETNKNEQQLEMISALMGADAELLPDFIEQSNKTYESINELLRTPAQSTQDFQKKADSMLALIHKIKGESAAFGLGFISETCHQFESELDALRSKPLVTGNDFLSLTIMLEQLISTNEKIESVHSNVLSKFTKVTPISSTAKDDTNEKLYAMAREVAKRQGKEVNLNLAGFDGGSIPSKHKLDIVSIGSQLLRNSIAHGIELPEDRAKGGKQRSGNITLSLFDQGEGGFRLICEDDGRGIDFKVLAQKALEEGLIDQANVAPGKLINLMLSKRLSGKDDADEDAGRGVGLTVVGEIAQKLGGKVALQTRPAEGTRFTIRFSKLVEPNLLTTSEVA